ncbi:hypothetical protein [Desulfonatronum lacustre]|uniref:hypothetical protein n=1 Tax=Desulfonatronum lacustre TaxID=66849 RepID=UPI0012EBECB6|nr:hypothetical protein [Desulfonatronum lacustre]
MTKAERPNGSEKKIIIIAGPNGAGKGGHNIPEAIIRRRYEAGWRYFRDLYRDRVDFWQFFDHSRDVPVLLEEKI